MLYSAGGEGMTDPGRPVAGLAPAAGTRFLDIMPAAPEVLPAWLTESDVDVYAEGLAQGGLFGR